MTKPNPPPPPPNREINTLDTRDNTARSPVISEPCRRAYSREEMIEEAKAYMRETWGPCRESEDRGKWHERLGMLVDFIHDRFPANPPKQRSDGPEQEKS